MQGLGLTPTSASEQMLVVQGTVFEFGLSVSQVGAYLIEEDNELLTTYQLQFRSV